MHVKKDNEIGVDDVCVHFRPSADILNPLIPVLAFLSMLLII